MRNVPIRRARLVPTFVALASACCGRPAPATPATVSPLLAGRARTVTFECPGADTWPQHYPMTCAFSNPSLFWNDIDASAPPPELAQVPRPRGPVSDPCVYGIRICGVTTQAPEGSKALACDDDDGHRDGPVEVVAPDGSLLAQGFCVQGSPVGAWLWWQHGELARSISYAVSAAPGVRYVAPGSYAYGTYKLVPVEEVKR